MKIVIISNIMDIEREVFHLFKKMTVVMGVCGGRGRQAK